MKLLKPYCPFCAKPAIGTFEALEGVANFSEVDEDGETEYTGYTEIDWDSQESKTGPNGNPLLVCAGGHFWESEIIGQD